MPLSCFFFRPAKVCRKRLTSGFNPLVGTGTRFLPERRTQGVLATLGVGLFEEFCHTTAGGSLSAPVCAEVLEQTLVYKGVPRAAVPDAPASDAETSADLPEDGDSFDGA